MKMAAKECGLLLSGGTPTHMNVTNRQMCQKTRAKPLRTSLHFDHCMLIKLRNFWILAGGIQILVKLCI
jgi:hypothetical protein